MDFKLDFNDLQEQAKRGVFNIIAALSALSPIILVLSMLALFVSLGYFQYLHFSETMTKPVMAVTAAALYQLIRFGTALASIRLFSARAYFRGGLSLVASFVLTYLESGMVTDTAVAISTGAGDAVRVNAWIIGVFVWLSWSLEVFISVTLKAMFDATPAAATAVATTTPSTRTAASVPVITRDDVDPDFKTAAQILGNENFHDAAAILERAEKVYQNGRAAKK